jgi:arylamine N-acetyltransferase
MADLDLELRDRVLERLGLRAAPAPDLEGLRALYRAWCVAVPFDNVRKMVALRAGDGHPLPGRDAAEFFESWLAHGTGGTCWPSSNALFALVRAVGFATRRVAGSMRDLGVVNHASVKVALDGQDWLVDSSLLTNVPLPLGPAVFVHDDPVFPVEVEASDATHVVWTHTPPNEAYLPCRLLVDPADHALYLDGYERSRARSPFNQRLYARRNRPGELLLLAGRTRFSRTEQGLECSDLSREGLVEALCEDFGLGAPLVDAWVRCGGLDASFEPPSGPKPPAVTQRPPSQR